MDSSHFVFSVVGSGRSARLVLTLDMGDGNIISTNTPLTGLLAVLNNHAQVSDTPIPETMLVESSPQPADTCSICLEDLLDGVVSLRRCGHHFHALCIRQCRRPVCPNCRENYGAGV